MNTSAATDPHVESSSGESSPARPANTNASTFVETWPVGDPRASARLLAQILVRRALVDVGMIPEEPQRESSTEENDPTAQALSCRGGSHR